MLSVIIRLLTFLRSRRSKDSVPQKVTGVPTRRLWVMPLFQGETSKNLPPIDITFSLKEEHLTYRVWQGMYVCPIYTTGIYFVDAISIMDESFIKIAPGAFLRWSPEVQDANGRIAAVAGSTIEFDITLNQYLLAEGV